jgi:hypothetical protein
LDASTQAPEPGSWSMAAGAVCVVLWVKKRKLSRLFRVR